MNWISSASCRCERRGGEGSKLREKAKSAGTGVTESSFRPRRYFLQAWVTSIVFCMVVLPANAGNTVVCQKLTGFSKFLPYLSLKTSSLDFDNLGKITLVLDEQNPDVLNSQGISKKKTGTITYKEMRYNTLVVLVDFFDGDNETYTISRNGADYEVIAIHNYWNGGMVPRVSFLEASCSEG
ncbi:MAG: hypothetical protein H0T56_18335 [Pseudaminobacter sp.]|nr:hypothetical protein [Pseudaminobacter sp.]